MSFNEKVLSFLDLLDLDEEVIDTKLLSIMKRSNFTNKHLTNALQLLRYKYLIYEKDEEDCDNVREFDFAAKLIKDISEDTVDNVCKITNIVLKLNPKTLYAFSEHLLMQILCNIESSCDNLSKDGEREKSTTLLHLKVCDFILNAVIEKGEVLSMVFLEVPLEKILSSSDEQAKVHFLTSTVPKLFNAVDKYDILTAIWFYLKDIRGESKTVALKVLSSLSDYYLPVFNKQNVKYESTVVQYYEFWDIILYGLMSDDPSLRKISIYLAKRAIDYITSFSNNLNVESNGHTIFTWDSSKKTLYKNQWDNFFILMDSLEEKQSNIVLPSLQLFEKLNEIKHCWIVSAYNIGLKHDNNQVRLKCSEYRMKTHLKSDQEATILLQALDDIHFYENLHERENLKAKLTNLFNHEQNLINILKAISQAKLSPVPFYHMTEILANLNITVQNVNVTDIVNILKSSCNVIAMRKAIHLNIAHFAGKSCKSLNWRDISNIISNLQIDVKVLEVAKSPIINVIRNLVLDETEKHVFLDFVTMSHLNIDIGLIYLRDHQEDLNVFTESVKEKVKNIQNITQRQFADKSDCIEDVLYISTLLEKCEKDTQYSKTIEHNIENNTIVKYIFCLLSSDTNLNIDQIKSLFANDVWTNGENNTLIDLYKTSVILLRDPRTDLDKIILSMLIVHNLTNNLYLLTNYKHEMLNLKSLMELVETFAKRLAGNDKSVGRTRNVFYEKHSETVHSKILDKDVKIDNHMQEIVNYIDKVMDCGGYGCLKWILKIVNNIQEKILNSKINFNMTNFINRTWKEIEELKTNNQYTPCMKEFVTLITQEPLAKKSEYNNTVILYFNRIIEYGVVKNSPLYYLVEKLYNYVVLRKDNGINIKDYGHLVYVLSEILMYCPVPRKDQRIADNLALEILNNPKYGIEKTDVDLHFNYEIQHLAVSILSKIDDAETLKLITTLIINKIDNIFKSKLRYHGNSQIHRTFQTGLQHLLFMFHLKSDSQGVSDWCMDLLGRLPHQLSVRLCLEWYIALHFYKEKATLNAKLLQVMQSKKLSLPSQFTIIYWLIKKKISNGNVSKEAPAEYEFVMDTLLSYTMGQMFNIRLLAQYLASKLYQEYENNTKYQYIIEVINKTLEDNSQDKNFVKLKEDYFFKEFDIIGNLTPLFIYYVLPRLCEVNLNEAVDTEFILENVKEVNKIVEENNVFNDWANCKKDEELMRIDLNRNVEKKIQEDVELGTIQKKYIPWKSMSDIDVYNVDKKQESASGLIVVASLIDKLPNLGGMARTSEVFGVKTYVIDSLRHLQDKQFQGLSVSAERWINVEEIRPGQPLKEYLNQMKAEGYSVVAAEQTSTSSKLQTFKFPKKTLLLLGHEKEGIPCDLLPLMDHCVEIPQQGFVRSLNVHVTAAIFVWEYTRQNLL